MKFETKSTQESTIIHYDKSGMDWYGCAVIYYLYKIKPDDKDNIVYDGHGAETYKIKKNIVSSYNPIPLSCIKTLKYYLEYICWMLDIMVTFL